MRLAFKTNYFLNQGRFKPFLLLHLRFNSTAITYNMLRPYQKDCIKTCLEELEKGTRKQVVSLPVGKLMSKATQISKYSFQYILYAIR